MHADIPTYLETVRSGGDGWPIFVADEAKAWATRRALAYFGGATGGPCCLPTTADFADWLFDPHRQGGEPIPDCLRHVALVDSRLAVAHRALLAAGAHLVWMPSAASHLMTVAPARPAEDAP